MYAGEDRHGWGTDGSDADTDIDSVTVRLSLGAPTITGTAQVGETLTAVTTGITDADGLTSPTYTYQWIRVNGTAADIASANSSTYTLDDADLGKAIKVKVSFTDDASNAETRTSAATATVTATNNAPTVANEIPDQTATVGMVFLFELPEDTFTDADSDTLTYTATQSDDTALPSWLAFDRVAGFSGLPQAADVETLSVKVTASDGNGGSVSATFDIVVSADTTTTCASPCLVSNVGQPPSSAEGFADSDFSQPFTTGDNTTGYTLTSIELNLGGSATVTTTPTVKLFSVSATGTEEATFTGPAMLGADTIENHTFTPSSPVALLGSTTYWVVAEGAAGVSWSSTPSTIEDGTPTMGWSIGDSKETRPASSTGSFTAETGNAPLLIRVNGTLGSTTPTNVAPTVANPIDDQTATAGTALNYAFPANTFADADSDTLTYTASQSDDTALPSWLSFDAATRTFSGTPAAADLGTVSVKVTASDGTLSVSDTFDIVVSAAPTAPMVTDVDVTSSPDSGDTYGTGEMILFTVTFDHAVTVTGAPEFEFCLGTTSTMSCDMGAAPPARRRAALSSGSGTTMLVFGYTVVEGDMDDNGIWTGDQSRSIKLEGGTIQGTVGGLDAVLTHAEEGQHDDHKVNGAAANTAPTADDNTVTTGRGQGVHLHGGPTSASWMLTPAPRWRA